MHALFLCYHNTVLRVNTIFIWAHERWYCERVLSPQMGLWRAGGIVNTFYHPWYLGSWRAELCARFILPDIWVREGQHCETILSLLIFGFVKDGIVKPFYFPCYLGLWRVSGIVKPFYFPWYLGLWRPAASWSHFISCDIWVCEGQYCDFWSVHPSICWLLQIY